jgi:hypothetical protein
LNAKDRANPSRIASASRRKAGSVFKGSAKPPQRQPTLKRGKFPHYSTVPAAHPPHRPPVPPPPRSPSSRPVRTRARIEETSDASLLDVLDNLLNRGVVLNADIILALAGVDLIYLRLSALLCAADRVLPPDDGRK